MREAVEAAWERVVEGWDDPARHDAFLGLVAQDGEFMWAVGKYKERAGDAIADKQLEKIRKAATATMFASATRKRREDPPYKRTLVIFALLIVTLLVGLIGVKLLHDTRPRPEHPRGTPARATPPRGTPAPTTPARH